MSTTQGSVSYANRTEISDSMKAGIRGRMAFLKGSELDRLTVTQRTEEQRLFTSRAVRWHNVYESGCDTEVTTEDGSLKRKRVHVCE
jgi:hypothetical protein